MKNRHIFIVVLVAIFFKITQANAQYKNESQVPNYQLPSLLRNSNGSQVTSKSAWESSRRKEILNLFEDHVYGDLPQDYDDISFKVVNENKSAINGKATLKEVDIKVTRKGRSMSFRLTLFTPNKVKGPAPAFVLINTRAVKHIDPTRKFRTGTWPVELMIENGYAMAGFQSRDLADMSKKTFMNGALKLYPEQMNSKSGMRAIGAWSWGVSRIIDYFEKDKSVDARKVMVVGHSRGGKAALWAAAKDKRIAIPFSHCAGKGGPAIYRRKFGESLGALTASHGYWFADHLRSYKNRENDLPIDAHMLIALMAPRPVYVSNTTRDLHADPNGSFLALKHAEPTFALYGIKGMPVSKIPAANKAIINSRLGYHNREGKHSIERPDWQNFIDFADYHLKNIKGQEPDDKESEDKDKEPDTKKPEKEKPASMGSGLTATYFDNINLSGKAVKRVDRRVNFEWKKESPLSGFDQDYFSVRWEGKIQAKYSETYTFYAFSDDGVRVWVNGKLLINDWRDHAPSENKGTIKLQAGKKYSIKMEYYEKRGGAVAKLLWSSNSQDKQVIPSKYLFPLKSGKSNSSRIASDVETVQNVEPQVLVYPVPANDEVTVETQHAEVENIRVINSLGVTVISQTAVRSNQVKLAVSQLAAGVYIVEVKTAQGKVITKRIVVKR